MVISELLLISNYLSAAKPISIFLLYFLSWRFRRVEILIINNRILELDKVVLFKFVFFLINYVWNRIQGKS